MQMKKLKLASLFSGCGGMDIGFEGGFPAHKSWLNHEEVKNYKKFNKNNFTTLTELQIETIFACDVNAKAKVAWDYHFSKKRDIDNVFELRSIVDIVKEIKSGTKAINHKIDIVTGGFPCNDFSVAGKRKGFNSDKSHQGNKKLIQGDDDATVENRGMLYFWMREFISLVKPKIFYAENVKGLVSLGDAKEIIAKDFASINGSSYFVVPVKVLRAIDYGIPQTRERVIFIGLNRDFLRASVNNHIDKTGELPANLNPYPAISHGLSDLINENYFPFATCKDAFAGLVEPELSKDLAQQAYSKAKHFTKKMQGGAEINLNKPGPTIRAEHHGNIEFRRLSEVNGGKNSTELVINMPQRRLTVRECARLQTFPDDYEFVVPEKISASDGYRLIGNAVPPLLAYRLGQRLEEIWDELFKSR
jgi:DNA (cytosine-5)-methyltransferase 1